MKTIAHFTCSHPKCDTILPRCDVHQEIPQRWSVVRVEEHGSKNVRIYYLYLCPNHTITTTERQTSLV